MSTEMNGEPFDVALAALVAHMQNVKNSYLDEHKYAWTETLTTERGPRYVRIVNQSHGQHSVVGFVRRDDGAILYPAGWKGPYLKGKQAVRGSIYDSATWERCIGWHGVKTIR